MTRHLICWLVLSLFLVCSAATGFALSVETHGSINDEIAKKTISGFSLDSYLKSNLGLNRGIDELFYDKEVYTWLKLGGRYEDKPEGTPPYVRSVNHFHNPLKPLVQAGFTGVWGSGVLSGKSAILWSQSPIGTQNPGGHYSWFDVRDYFFKALTSSNQATRNTNFAETFRGLGQLMHLVQDQSVPEHARDDGHYLDAYEEWVKDTPSSGDPQRAAIWTNALANPIFASASMLGQPGVFGTQAPVPIANLLDTNQYDGTNPNVTLNQNMGLSEYTNANYVSDDTLFSGFPFPSKSSSVVVQDYIIPDPVFPGQTVARPYYKKIADGDSGYRLAGVGYLVLYLDELDPLSSYAVIPPMDGHVYGDYAQKLIPRAVGYSAGLLKYFFRGQMEAVDAKTVRDGFGNIAGVKLKVKNSTPNEEMSVGKFAILYQYKPAGSDQLVMGGSGEVYLTGTISSGSESASEFTFDFNSSIPSDAQEVKYWLVYKGKLGNEQDAVIGKIFDVKSVKEYVFLVSTAPYGKKPNGNRIKITALMPFEMNVQNNSYSLKPANTFSLPGEMYFDSTYTTSLVINSNEEKNYHKVYYTMDDEEFNLRWSASLRNYGCTVIGYWSEQYPPTGSTNPSCWAYLKTEYSSSWASGRRTNNISYRGYKGYQLGYDYSGGIFLNDTGKEWQQSPLSLEHTEGSPYTERHSVIARTGNKAIYIKRDANNIWETKEFPCQYGEISTWKYGRWKWTGQQTLYFGDIIIKALDYYGAKFWGSNVNGNAPYYCSDLHQFLGEQQEYVVRFPGGGSSVGDINTDRIIDIMDYDNFHDGELFVLFYSIRDHRTSGYPIDYYLTYKTGGNAIEVPIFSGIQGKDRIYGVSSQLNKGRIVYSYYIQHSNAPSYPLKWTPEKYVVGIINIADEHLDHGHRQEFEYHPLAEGSSPSNLALSPTSSGNLSPGTYTYYVAAVNPINQTLASAPASVTLSSEQKGVVLNWSAVEGATHYIVYGRSSNPVALTLKGSTTWTDTGSNSEMGSDPSNPWALPASPVKPFLSAIGVHRMKLTGSAQ